ncbi:MAG: DEAD/DEAH box helicase [Gammaproteobacteria bacterium]|nr:DEAD/DEAH box helicase [Gammaproteobacteria bacterium]
MQPVFDDISLHDDLRRGLEKQALTEPTPVQREAVPAALEGRDLLVSAETGSGKTLAFLLPTLQRLLVTEDSKLGTRALALVPTRELAQQILEDCLAIGSYTQLRFGLIVGGESMSRQRALLRKNPEILIATPGRLRDLVEQGLTHLDALEVLILDEADRMLDMGFSPDVLAIVAACNRQRQTMLFSATLAHSGVRKIASEVLKEPLSIRLNSVKDKQENIRQQMLLADDYPHKLRLLGWLLENETYAKALVFLNKRSDAENLGAELRKTALRSGVLHGEMDQAQRRQVMKRLHDGLIHILVATDVAARGLDVNGIDLVINFHVPRNARDYVHRIGRTGRAGQQGLAISLVSHPEWNTLAGIERYLDQPIERRLIKELAGSYKGPKKVKNSGKAAGKKKQAGVKKKQRLRDKKQIGKRRKPSVERTVASANAGAGLKSNPEPSPTSASQSGSGRTIKKEVAKKSSNKRPRDSTPSQSRQLPESGWARMKRRQTRE